MGRRRQIIVKGMIVALPLALLIGWLVARESQQGQAVAVLRNILGWPLDASKFLFEIVGQGEWFSNIYEIIITGSRLPYTVGFVFWLIIATFLVKITFHKRPLIDWLWASFPVVLDPRLERQTKDVIDPFKVDTIFLGRKEELRQLRLFAGEKGGSKPSFMVLTGREGTGKTRLAIEWMKELAKLGWDVGLLKENVELKDVSYAHFRRRSAIVIDEAGGREGLWPLLATLLEHKPRIRILLVDQTAPQCPDDMDKQPKTLIEAANRDIMRAKRLDIETLEKISPDISPNTLKAADGRPLFVLLGDDPAAEIARRAERRLNLVRSNNDNERRLLALAALAAPLSHHKRRTIPNTKVSLPRMQKLFGGLERSEVTENIPRLRPEALASEVLLRIAADETEADLTDFFKLAIKVNPLSVQRRLGHLWRIGELPEEREQARQIMQDVFDDEQPDLVKAIHQNASDLAALAREFDGKDLSQLDEIMANLTMIFTGRPFDKKLMRIEAYAAGSASHEYGVAQRFDDFEHWAKRLLKITCTDTFQDKDEAKILEIRKASCAMQHYGQAEELGDLERWGKRLVVIVDNPAFASNLDIKIEGCNGAVNAMRDYGDAQQFDDLERWGKRLISIVNNPDFAKDPDIRNEEAKGAFNAMLYYGMVQQFDDLERWGKRLIAIADNPAFAKDPYIRLTEARGAFNSMLDYGKVGMFDDFERWGERLIAIVNNAAFANNSAIRNEEAKGAANAMLFYGDAQQFDDLERWGKRLMAIVNDAAFAKDPDIRLNEARGANNAMGCYGKMQQFDHLERWGEQFMAIANNPVFANNSDIRYNEAGGAHNALVLYGKDGRQGGVEYARWRERLAAAARDFPSHAAIQHLAKNFQLTAVDQKVFNKLQH